ncbi:MAG: nucleotide sugar dehydrogenase [Erysipelotrichaceae bacterium]|nr:nucleotide sugar dehydrogenase [Erysipelotrichaceae bacterium]
MLNIIGLGYIGLPTALIFAARGIEVVGTDYNETLISKLKKGELTFEEKGLAELFNEAQQKGIEFTTDYLKTNMYIITVPTPYDKVTKKIDPAYLIAAVNSILEVCENDSIIIIESTVSPGTIDKFIRPIISEFINQTNQTIHLVHAPERIIPGDMVHELANNSRTIGADSYEVGEKVAQLYQNITSGEIVITDIKTAEMTKVVENTYRAINIAFANELAKIADYDDMDVYEIIRISNMHPRVNILSPGPGVGGHCIPVDPWFLVGDYPLLTPLIKEALDINESMPAFVLKKVSQIMKEKNLNDFTKVGLYGLTYKANVDDVRESPTLQILELQEKFLAHPLKTYDPWVKEQVAVNQYFDFAEFLNGVELVVIMVKHDHIKESLEHLKGKIIFDTQNTIPASDDYILYKL